MSKKELAKLSDLAFFGGKQKLFSDDNVKSVGAPKSNCDIDDFCLQVKEIITSGQWTNNGKYVQRLEKEIAAYFGVEHAVLVCNATIGLQVALKALDVVGEVIVPSFTFVATAHAAAWLGLDVRFCDINPETLMLDAGHLQRLITPKTAAIVPVHVYGRVADIEAIETAIGSRKISIVTDAAHAFGCRYADGSFVGTKGTCEVFSLHATKCFSTMEGGLITTNDPALATKLRKIINFGFSGYDQVSMIGTNAKMCEVAAAFGLQQLKSFLSLLDHNRTNFALYQRLFREQARKDNEWCKFVSFLDATTAKCNCHYVVLRWKKNGTRVDRDFVVAALNSENCQLRRYFFPGVHAFAPYKDYQPWLEQTMPHTNEIAQEVICLPSGTQMSEHDIIALVQTIVFLWTKRDEIHGRLLSPDKTAAKIE